MGYFQIIRLFFLKKMIGGQVIIEQVNQTRKTEEENRKWGGWAAAQSKEIFFFSA